MTQLGPLLDDAYLASLGSPGGPMAWGQEIPRRRSLKVVSAHDLANERAPERLWLVPEMIPRGKTTLLYGNGGDGKSLLNLQLNVAVATGTDWIGHMPEPGGVLLISAEDDVDEVHRRLADIVSGRPDINVDDLSNLRVVDLAGEDAILAAPQGRSILLTPTPLFTEVERLVEEHRPILLSIDTAADVFGGDENVRSQVRQFLGLLTGLAIRYEMAVVVLAHPSLSGMTSGAGTGGSTAWSNSVRSRLYLAPVKTAEGVRPDPCLKQLTVMKNNYGPTGETISLRWERGRFVLAGGGWQASQSNAEVDEVFVNLLKLFINQNRNVVATPGKSYAPSEFASHADSRGVSKGTFKQSMDRLLATGRIENVEYGPPSTRRSKLAFPAMGESNED
ncbi:AAA family ATPase [Methylocella silvestris]|uniref:ATPase n=1 Tax=Methylocella silvestris TaxID=199596 RepID=A0A2J7TM93_METSI|nr:AAA family ATPase [Methylocella silvestris]PNG27895.1 ATPase [Methylocella silvestris]